MKLCLIGDIRLIPIITFSEYDNMDMDDEKIVVKRNRHKPNDNENNKMLKMPKKKKTRLNENKKENETERINSLSLNENQDDIYICKAILMNSSPVLDTMLSNKMKESKDRQIEIQCARKEDVDHIVYFIIVGELHAQSNLFNLAHIGHLYKIDGLFEMCMDTLSRNIRLDSFVKIVYLFDKFCIEKGYKNIMKFGRANYQDLNQREDFLKLRFGFRRQMTM